MCTVSSKPTHCRHCGEPLRQQQQVFHHEKNGVVLMHREIDLVDCENLDCDLYMVTLSVEKYVTADLSQYANVIRSAGEVRS